MTGWFWFSMLLATLLLYGLWMVHTVKMKIKDAVLRVRNKNYSSESMIKCIEDISKIVVDF